ncbi:MAG: acyl-CoA thioester hydrolase/BAAT C-terminal domain-containing protein [Verrucomicrobiota bacterium]
MKPISCSLIIAALLGGSALSGDAQVVRTDLKGEGFVADFYCKAGPVTKPGLLFLGGSEGGRPDLHLPQFLAEHGYPVLAVAYFKEQGLPETLQLVPLEYFDKALAWMAGSDRIPHDGIAVFGCSKGAELALLLASRKPEIKGVIALAPSSVVWDGMPKQWWPPDPKSSWSSGGKPLPIVPYDYRAGFAAGDPRAIYKFYAQSLKQTDAVGKAAILVEKINGPILLASGHDDLLWPSEEMSDVICARLKAKTFTHHYEHLKYADAGHTLNEYYMLGGTREGNQDAGLPRQTFRETRAARRCAGGSCRHKCARNQTHPAGHTQAVIYFRKFTMTER